MVCYCGSSPCCFSISSAVGNVGVMDGGKYCDGRCGLSGNGGGTGGGAVGLVLGAAGSGIPGLVTAGAGFRA